MYFEDAAGKFHLVDTTGGMLVYITPSFDIFFLLLSDIVAGVRFYLSVVGSVANFRLVTISPVVVTSKPSLLVSV